MNKRKLSKNAFRPLLEQMQHVRSIRYIQAIIARFVPEGQSPRIHNVKRRRALWAALHNDLNRGKPVPPNRPYFDHFWTSK